MIQTCESHPLFRPILSPSLRTDLLRKFALSGMLLVLCSAVPHTGATPLPTNTPALAQLSHYFESQTAQLRHDCLDLADLADWKSRREQYRQQLFEMLSLNPLPERTDLKATVTGKVEHEAFTVENLHFQSMPGLYVTANLYLPKNLSQPAPTILYVSGHGPVISNGVSYGNKVAYQHHGAWFARNGYICLILDTLQLGEIQGLHHGTYRENLWWWNSRGYTPAGVEAWNSIRALDYLQTRPEVDPKRFGVTGRSGGGAYSWWVSALDERIKVAAPVAGITDLQNHVVDGVVEGHCDCMFTVNTYRWDYPQVAALFAPRPLLIVNTDSDTIFPLDGVMWLHGKVRKLYKLYGAETNLGITIGPGPHKDTQDLQIPVFRWFNRHLKGADPVIEMAAVKLFEPHQLKVFKTLPADARNTNIHASFVPVADTPYIPDSAEQWDKQQAQWLKGLAGKTFAGWPANDYSLSLKEQFSAEHQGLWLTAFDYTSQPNVRLRLYLLSSASLKKPARVQVTLLGDENPAATNLKGSPNASFDRWLATLTPAFSNELRAELASASNTKVNFTPHESLFPAIQAMLSTNNSLFAYIAPRGCGLDSWDLTPKQSPHVRRRFMLLGQTLDGMRVWDVRRGIQALKTLKLTRQLPLEIEATGVMASHALYASLFEPGLAKLNLWDVTQSHMNRGEYLNILRVLDVPATIALAAARNSVILHTPNAEAWTYPVAVSRALKWPAERLQVRTD